MTGVMVGEKELILVNVPTPVENNTGEHFDNLGLYQGAPSFPQGSGKKRVRVMKLNKFDENNGANGNLIPVKVSFVTSKYGPLTLGE